MVNFIAINNYSKITSKVIIVFVIIMVSIINTEDSNFKTNILN